MKTSSLLKIAAVALAVTALGACSDAIFATIETERRSSTNLLSETLNVVGIESAAPGSGVYDVGAGAVFQGALSGFSGTITWNPNTTITDRPFNPSGLVCNVMASFGGNLYGGFTDQAGNSSFYWAYAASPTSWTAIPIPAGWQQVTFLRAANGNLFLGLVDSTNSNYALYYSTNGATWNPTSVTGLTKPIKGVGFDGTNYWAVASNYSVFEGATPTTMSMVYPTGTQAGNLFFISTDTINGLFADPVNLGRVFIVTKTTGIFYTLNGGSTWTRINADQPSGSANPVSYLSVGGPVDVSAGNVVYLVGADGFGYYTLNISGGGSWSRFGDSTILLFTASVANIFVDQSFGQCNVLLGTNAQGVWRAVFDSTLGAVINGTNQYWIHE